MIPATLAHAGKSLARAMVIFVVVSVGIASLNMVHRLGELLVVTTPAYATAFGPAGSDGMALLLMDLQHQGSQDPERPNDGRHAVSGGTGASR